MNFYTRINKTILERLPTMWNTQFVWMILICLLTHALYFGLGYASLNFEVLKEYGVRSLFTKGAYFSFYAIIGLLALIFFGFRYFAHNPFKHFYPVSKTYFWKILGQLFVIFFLYGTVFISFENGMKLKGKTLVPIEVVEKEAYQIELAKPFLYNDISNYHINDRSFPEPFPCDDVENIVIGYDSVNDIEIKHRIDYKKSFVGLDRANYQFGKIKNIRIDSCNTKEVLDTIYDVSKIYGLAEYSLYNYSGNELNRNRKYINETRLPEEVTDIELEKIHNWHKNKDSVAIAKTIKNVQDICTKYAIPEQLDPMKMANAGLKQDLNKQQLLRTGFEDYRKYISDRIGTSDANAVEVTSVDDNGNGNTNVPPQIAYNFFADIPTFTTLHQNTETLTEEMGTVQLKTEAFWALLFASLGFAMFFVMVKYIVPKDLIIGIFVAGVLMAILGLYVSFTERFEDGNSEIRVTKIALVYATIVFGFGLYAILGKGLRKQFVTKLFVAFGIATVAFFPLLLFYIQQNAYSMVTKACDKFASKVYTFELAPWHFIGLALLSIFIIFTMLRKLYAKVE